MVYTSPIVVLRSSPVVLLAIAALPPLLKGRCKKASFAPPVSCVTGGSGLCLGNYRPPFLKVQPALMVSSLVSSSLLSSLKTTSRMRQAATCLFTIR